MGRIFLAVACAASFTAAGQAFAASANGKASIDAWHGMDTCSKKAFEIFPDYTPEHVSKRDAYVRKCLVERNLPSRDGIGARP
jgi:hypothetical protein